MPDSGRMGDYHGLAEAALKRTIEFNPKLMSGNASLIDIAKGRGDQQSSEKLVTIALSRDPASHEVRKAYVFASLPKWGGSAQKVMAFLEYSKTYKGRDPHQKPLGGLQLYEHG